MDFATIHSMSARKAQSRPVRPTDGGRWRPTRTKAALSPGSWPSPEVFAPQIDGATLQRKGSVAQQEILVLNMAGFLGFHVL